MFLNDPRKIADMRALAVIFDVQSWKTNKRFTPKNIICCYDKKKMLIEMFSPTSSVYQIW